MLKKEHIQYWITSSENDWEVAQSLIHGEKFLYALFFAHLTLEKLLKGHWVKDNIDNYPPRIHSLVRILEGTNFRFDEDTLVFLELLNDFQLEWRYPDYQFKIYKRCNKEFTEQVFDRLIPIRKCLLETLQSTL